MTSVKFATLSLAALLLLAGSEIWSRAQEKQAPKEPAIATDALTHETLKEMLENLGYEPKVIKGNFGPLYKLNFSRDEYRYGFNVSLSSNGAMLWLMAPLQKLPEPKDVRVDILEEILIFNEDSGPTHISMGKGRMLYLNVAIGNRHITAVQLRKTIDGFCRDIKTSEPLWNPERYPPKAEAKK